MTTTTTVPRNLAQLKRFLKPGMKLAQCYHHMRLAPLEDPGRVLTIKSVGSVDFVFEPNDYVWPLAKGNPVHHRWQKSDGYTFHDDGFSTTDEATGRVLSTYGYVLE